MHQLKTDTTKILPNNKLKTNFLSDKSKKLSGYLKEVHLYSKILKTSLQKMLKNTYNKCLSINVCKKKSVSKEILIKKKKFPQNIPKI